VLHGIRIRGVGLSIALIVPCLGLSAALPSVHVESGDLEGVASGEVIAYRGIPYAAPPLGALRWRAPQPPAHWSGVRSAKDFGFSCPQSAISERTAAGDARQMSEDCLTLNVWTQPSGAARPVMVWIHGGGDVEGSSANRYYDGTAFARDGIVLVSVNYRLGNLGFFAHPALTREDKASGANYALLDQLAALAWVQRNIAALGGDPANVTVFGESAGALDVLALMTTTQARGLFHKAIVESAGIWTSWPSLKDAQAAGVRIATRLKLPGADATAAQLRALPAQQLVREDDSPGLLPVIDGTLLRDEPLRLFAQGKALAIPLMIGSNDAEGSLLGESATNGFPTDDGAAGRKVRSLYGEPAEDDAVFARLLFRDEHFAAPARFIAAQQSVRAPVFLYRFDYVLDILRARRAGAFHGSEIPFVFATAPEYRLTSTDRSVEDTLHACWIGFAQSGTPHCSELSSWPAYQPRQDLMIRFGNMPSVQKSPDASVLDALERQFQ
jgi:para-nitrobenzyl esterase